MRVYNKKHFYIIYNDRKENSGRYPHDIILERLITYDVAKKYVEGFYESFCRENTLSVKNWVDPILITNDTRLYMQFKNVFSPSDFEKYCIQDNMTTPDTFEQLNKILEGRYNTAEMYTKYEKWTDDDGNCYNCEIENGWRTSSYMTTNKFLTNGAELDDEYYKAELIKITDYHYDWWENLSVNWKRYFANIITNGVFGGIPTHFALADLLTMEDIDYEFGNGEYFQKLHSITPLSQFLHLRKLNLKHNKIEDLNPLANIKTLESLNIENNLVESLSPLSNLPNLTELNASSNRIKNIDVIPSLKKLVINNNLIEEMLCVTKCKEIEYLEINYNQLSELGELPMLKHLRHLSLKGNKITNLEPLAFLKKLEVLNLDYTQIENIEPLKKIRSLKNLSIRNNKINDLTPISRLDGLKYLDCGGNQISYGEATSLSLKLGFKLNYW